MVIGEKGTGDGEMREMYSPRPRRENIQPAGQSSHSLLRAAPSWRVLVVLSLHALATQGPGRKLRIHNESAC